MDTWIDRQRKREKGQRERERRKREKVKPAKVLHLMSNKQIKKESLNVIVIKLKS